MCARPRAPQARGGGLQRLLPEGYIPSSITPLMPMFCAADVCLLGWGSALFTQVPGRGILRSSDAESCIGHPLRSASIASKALHAAWRRVYILWCWMEMQRDE